MNIRRILFPTDFSEGSKHALEYAVDLVKHYDAELHILHVIYDIAEATESHIPHISTDQLYKDLNDWAYKEIDSCCIEHTRELTGTKKTVAQGIPYEEIIRYAADEKIDIIVIGTVGRVGIERFIFGSTAERVVRKAPCPVMTVRTPAHKEA